MKKYQISPYYKFIKEKQLTRLDFESVEEIQKIKNGDLFLLYNKFRGERLLVNPAIFAFLTICLRPVSFNVLLKKMSKQFNEDPSVIRPIVSNFLAELLEKRIVFAAEHVQSIRKYIKSDQNILEPLKKRTVVDQYILTKLLSFHTPVEVHIAENLATNEKVILKLLRIEPDLDAEIERNMIHGFGQEFRIMKELKGHPNICKLLQHCEGQRIFGALEFLKGVSIRKRIQDILPLPTIEKRTDWYAQTLDAFAFMHEKGVLHGDVHTSNLLLCDDDWVKVIDFDMAFHAELKENETTHYGGAYDFIAPEKINIDAFHIACEPADFRSEVYQLGLVGYFLLFGKMPFKGVAWQELAENILKNEVDFRTKNQEISPEMIEFLKKAMNKNPKKRFKNAIEMKGNWAAIVPSCSFV